MSVPAIISDLSEVSEAMRAHYRKEGDVYVIEVDDFNSLPCVLDMKLAHEKAKAQKRLLKEGMAKASEEYGSAMKAARQAYQAALDELAKDIDESAPPATE